MTLTCVRAREPAAPPARSNHVRAANRPRPISHLPSTQLVSDLLFILDIPLNFRTAFIEDCALVLEPRRI